MKFVKNFENFNSDNLSFEKINESYLIELPQSTKNNLWKLCEILQSYIEQRKKFIDGQVLSLMPIEIDDNLKKIIPPKSNTAYFDFPKKEKLDDIAKELSKSRGVEIIFNKDLNAFTTKNGKGFLRIMIDDKSAGGHVLPQFAPSYRDGFCYEKGSLLFDKFGNNLHRTNSSKNGQLVTLPKDDSIRFRFADFTNGIIFLNINKILKEITDKSGIKLYRNISKGKFDMSFDYKEILFEVLEHEMTHLYDANLYLYSKSGYGGISGKGKYSGHDVEFPTLVNQLLSKLQRFFIDRHKIDKFLSDNDRTRSLQHLINIWEFFSGKKTDLDEITVGVLHGGLLSLPQKALIKIIPKMKDENPENYKLFLNHLLNKIKYIVEHLNKITEYQNKNEPSVIKGYSHKLSPITIGDKTIRTPDKYQFIRQIGLTN
jgi:hypothetical protein